MVSYRVKKVVYSVQVFYVRINQTNLSLNPRLLRNYVVWLARIISIVADYNSIIADMLSKNN